MLRPNVYKVPLMYINHSDYLFFFFFNIIFLDKILRYLLFLEKKNIVSYFSFELIIIVRRNTNGITYAGFYETRISFMLDKIFIYEYLPTKRKYIFKKSQIKEACLEIAIVDLLLFVRGGKCKCFQNYFIFARK